MTHPLVDDARILHVLYTDFIADQVGVVRHYYDFCRRNLTAEAETTIRDYLANNRGDRHGKFSLRKLLTISARNSTRYRGVSPVPRAVRGRDRET
jgi:hypothetical protein